MKRTIRYQFDVDGTGDAPDEGGLEKQIVEHLNFFSGWQQSDPVIRSAINSVVHGGPFTRDQFETTSARIREAAEEILSRHRGVDTDFSRAVVGNSFSMLERWNQTHERIVGLMDDADRAVLTEDK